MLRNANSVTGADACIPVGKTRAPDSTTAFIDMFSYTQAGQAAGMDLRVTMTQPQNLDGEGQCYVQTAQSDLNLVYAYNNEGKVTQVTYPTPTGGSPIAFSYGYDSMMRLSSMTDNSNYSQPAVNNATYNAANQLTALN